ncbi:MAG: hypothetical protein CMJ79_09150 [Planctomycetaceae bacterium]|nr:hypothetical protein [Planctomycetaceae bacterium]
MNIDVTVGGNLSPKTFAIMKKRRYMSINRAIPVGVACDLGRNIMHLMDPLKRMWFFNMMDY